MQRSELLARLSTDPKFRFLDPSTKHYTGKFILKIEYPTAIGGVAFVEIPFYRNDSPVSKSMIEMIIHRFKKHCPNIERLLGDKMH